MARTSARFLLFAPLAALVLACGPAPGSADPSLTNKAAITPGSSLGLAGAFSVLAGSTVTNTGPTTLTSDLGVSPGTALTGFPPGLLLAPATPHAADAVALQAQSDVTLSYVALAGDACTGDKTGIDLGGLTLTPGVYCFTSGAGLTGTLVLDAKGDPAAVFVFQIASTLTVASGASVQLRDGADVCNVFWQVGSSATVGTRAVMAGNILALTSIALQTGASLDGRALARNGAVTLDSNRIVSGQCATTGSTDAGVCGLHGPSGSGSPEATCRQGP